MNIGFALSIGLFIVSCFLPALEWKNQMKSVAVDVMTGARALAVGWSGIFALVMGWYANVFWLLAMILGWLRRPTASMIAGWIAVALACTVFFDIGRDLPGDEGGVTRTMISRLLPGFFVWMASLLIVPLVQLLPRFR